MLSFSVDVTEVIRILKYLTGLVCSVNTNMYYIILFNWDVCVLVDQHTNIVVKHDCVCFCQTRIRLFVLRTNMCTLVEQTTFILIEKGYAQLCSTWTQAAVTELLAEQHHRCSC